MRICFVVIFGLSDYRPRIRAWKWIHQEIREFLICSQRQRNPRSWPILTSISFKYLV